MTEHTQSPQIFLPTSRILFPLSVRQGNTTLDKSYVVVMFAVYAQVANHTYAGKAPEVAGRSSHDDISQTDW